MKNAERVRLEQIPLPEAPSTQAGELVDALLTTVSFLHVGMYWLSLAWRCCVRDLW